MAQGQDSCRRDGGNWAVPSLKGLRVVGREAGTEKHITDRSTSQTGRHEASWWVGEYFLGSPQHRGGGGGADSQYRNHEVFTDST